MAHDNLLSVVIYVLFQAAGGASDTAEAAPPTKRGEAGHCHDRSTGYKLLSTSEREGGTA